jgi:hypothetical protein
MAYTVRTCLGRTDCRRFPLDGACRCCTARRCGCFQHVPYVRRLVHVQFVDDGRVHVEAVAEQPSDLGLGFLVCDAPASRIGELLILPAISSATRR